MRAHCSPALSTTRVVPRTRLDPTAARRKRASSSSSSSVVTIAAKDDDALDAADVAMSSRAPTGGRARSFVGASFYEPTTMESYGGGASAASRARGAAGPMSASARRARGAMRPAANEKRRAKNRADDVIERRRKIEREMRSQMVEREVEKEVESLVKKRARQALDVERIDLRDGSVLFKFKVDRVPRAVTAEEERRLAVEVERRLWGDTKTNENLIARWFMTVKYLASTLSFENAVVYVASTPFRLVFWTLAYALRAVFWIFTGRGAVRASGRAKKQLRQMNTVVSTGPERGFNPFGSVRDRPNWRGT